MSKNNFTKPTKEQLQKQLNAIAKQEEKDIIAKYYPEFKKLEGTFYKVKTSYSCPTKPSDYWWIYTKVTEIKPDDVYNTNGNGVTCHFKGWSFQNCRDGNFSVEQEKIGYVHSLGKQITQQEFIQAWNNAMANLDKLK
jgi:hypothetical protein